MKFFLKILPALLCSFFLSAICVFAQSDIKIETANISNENIPPVKRQLLIDLINGFKWNQNSFIAWEKDGSLLGYDETYSPYLKTAQGTKTEFKLPLNAPEDIAASPFGSKYFVYTADPDGSENSRLFVYNTETRKSLQATFAPEIVKVNSYVWSDSVNEIFFINSDEKNNKSQLYKLNPETRQTTKVADFDNASRYITDASDAGFLIYEYVSTGKTDIYFLNAQNPAPVRLTPATDSVFYKQATFSPDKKGILWLSDKGGKLFNLYYFDLKSKREKRLNKEELNVAAFKLSPAGNKIALKTNNSGAESLRVFEYNAANSLGKEFPQAQIPQGVVERLGWKNDTQLGFTFESLSNAPEIRLLDSATGKTEISEPGKASEAVEGKIKDIQLIKWNSFDKKEVTGFLVKPKNSATGKFPVIIDIHGGPKRQFQPYFNLFKTFPAAYLNAVVILPNIRGSSGFGREFESADDGKLRENAFRDLESLLDWIKTQPDLDSSRIVLKGESFGAFMALGLAMKRPEGIKGVIAESPVISMLNSYNYSPANIRANLDSEYGTSGEMTALDSKNSLLGKVKSTKWSIPVFLSAGVNDPRVPVADIRGLKDELNSSKVPVWYIQAKNEGHIWNNYDNRIFLNGSEIHFLKTIAGF